MGYGRRISKGTTDRENQMSATPLYMRITEGIDSGSVVVAENETFQFGALGWSGGFRHVDLYRASGELVRFDLEYFKKVAVAVDHIGFQPQRKPLPLEASDVAAAFIRAGKPEIERLRYERDAFKAKLMETFVYMTLVADRIETNSISRTDLAEEIRRFVRDGHRLA